MSPTLVVASDDSAQWLTVPVVVALVYLLFILGPFYGNGMFRYGLGDFDRDGMHAGD